MLKHLVKYKILLMYFVLSFSTVWEGMGRIVHCESTANVSMFLPYYLQKDIFTALSGLLLEKLKKRC